MASSIAIIDPLGAHGGHHYYVHDQANALVAAGHPVAVFSAPAETDASGKYEKIVAFAGTYGDGSKLWRGASLAWQLVTSVVRARAKGCDTCIFHIFKGDVFELLGVGTARALGMRVLSVVHDVERLDRATGPGLMGPLVRLTNTVVVHNVFSRDTLLASRPELASKTAIVPHGNYASQFGVLPSRDEARQLLDIPREDLVMLFFGNPRKEKGLEPLLEALALSVKHAPVKLIVAGKMKPEDVTRIQDVLKSSGLEAMVRLDIGHVRDSLVAPYFRAADVIVLPYLRVYESGVAIMAMTLGRPVLASDLPPLLEVVGSASERGYLFKAGDVQGLAEQISAIASHPESIGSKGDAAASFARKERDWSISGKLTSELLSRQR
jgi:D-inositol-3-phosphate glycosyltransferase